MSISNDLRQAVLQAAIQGKLTKQLPEDGNAKDLLEQIKAEKEKLIKEGKLKKEKPMSSQKANKEKDYELPLNWVWGYLGDVTFNRDSERVPLSKEERSKLRKVYDYYGASGVIDKVDNYIFDERLLLVGEDGANLLARSTPIAFIAHGKYWVNNHAHVLGVGKYLCLDYLCLHINAINLSEYVSGTAQPKMNQENMNAIPIGIPPLSEQKRIVAKVEEVMAKIDELEKTEKELEALKKAFPADMKASLLQAAMQGKLTEQLSEDGNAKDLLEQIIAEKAKLIKEGKLKKEKPLPEITEDEILFDIPENWEWVRIGEICKFNPKNELDDEISVSFIPMACVDDGFNNSHTFEIKKWKDIKKGFSHFANEDIGVAKITPCFQNRKSVIFRNLENGCGAGTTELIVLRANNVAVMPKYLLWFFKSEGFISNGMKSFTGTAGQQRIHKDYLPNCVVPLPPLAEQKRIVEKLEKLLPLCDGLK